MATEDLSKTGFVTLGIKDPLPDSSDQEMTEDPMGFIPAERASTTLVAGQTDVNPLSVDLPNPLLMQAVSNFSGIDFNSSIQETPLIGSSSYTTNPSYKTDATTGEIISDGNFSNDVQLYQNITNAIDQTGKTESYKASTRGATQLVANPQLVQLLANQELQARAACMEYECNEGDHSFFGLPHESRYNSYQPYFALRR